MALGHFQRAVDLRPEIPETHNNLATALLSLGKYSDAIPAFRRALAIRPEYFNARLNLGRALIANGQAAAGRAELRKCERLRPGDPAVRQALRGK